MKSRFNNQPRDNREFPKIMVGDNDLYVFFWEEGQGIVIHSDIVGVRYEVGEFRTNWKMEEFRDTNAEITISNE